MKTNLPAICFFVMCLIICSQLIALDKENDVLKKDNKILCTDTANKSKDLKLCTMYNDSMKTVWRNHIESSCKLIKHVNKNL